MRRMSVLSSSLFVLKCAPVNDDDNGNNNDKNIFNPSRTTWVLFCSCNLDLDPMTLTYELDVDTLKLYQHTKNEVSYMYTIIV